MSAGRLSVLFLAILISCLSPARGQIQVQRPAPGVNPGATPQEKDKDKENMLAIHQALKTYEKEHGELPDLLSDLVPKYLTDTNVLVSPYFLRTGRQQLYGNEDPKLTTSYIYEFSAKPIPPAILGAFPQLDPGMTMKEWKIKQTEEFGQVVPIVRCHLYNPVLSVTLDGEFFESGPFWETDPKVAELRKARQESGNKQTDP